MRYHFRAETTGGDDFFVDVNDAGEVVRCKGIGESRVRFHTRRGGIDGLIRAMRYSHSVRTSRDDEPDRIGLVEHLQRNRTTPKESPTGERRIRRNPRRAQQGPAGEEQ